MKRIRIYIAFIILVLLLMGVLGRFEIIQKTETLHYDCKVMIDRWRSGCVWCYNSATSDSDESIYTYKVKKNDKTIIKFRLVSGELNCYIHKKEALILQDTLRITVHLSAQYDFQMKVPMDGKRYKVAEIPIVGKYTGDIKNKMISKKRMDELILYCIRD